jgi:Fe(3+) dicitrate transport protein
MKKKFELKSGVNNVFNKTYFTRRAGGYPGPGLLPGDGRTFFVSLGGRF